MSRLSFASLLTASLVAVAVAVAVTGCSGRDGASRDSPSPAAALPSSATPAPASASDGAALDTAGVQLAAAQTAQLRWIEGTWKGTGDVAEPFYERYTFDDDSTLTVLGFADSTLAVSNDTTVFFLRGGRFGNHTKPRRYVADTLAGDRVHFASVNARNAFGWRRVATDRWEATIIPSAAAGGGAQPPQVRRYTMSRYAR